MDLLARPLMAHFGPYQAALMLRRALEAVELLEIFELVSSSKVLTMFFFGAFSDFSFWRYFVVKLYVAPLKFS